MTESTVLLQLEGGDAHRVHQDASTIQASEQQHRASSDTPCQTDKTNNMSDDDDGLYNEDAPNSVDREGDSELVEEEDTPVSRDSPLLWKIKHSTGDHKLKGKPTGPSYSDAP
jgi:hypothetical protein